MDQLFIFGAKYIFLLSIVIFVYYFFKLEDKKKFLKLSIPAMGLAYVLGLISRLLFYNPRPFIVSNFKPLIDHVADNGFPSDHTLLVASIASVVTVFNKKIGIILWLITLMVAVSKLRGLKAQYL